MAEGPTEKGSAEFKKAVTPYFEYIYGLHASGKTKDQVAITTTGRECANMFTAVSTFDEENPGYDILKWSWKWFWWAVIKALEIIW
jgi:hypothetical protein